MRGRDWYHRPDSGQAGAGNGACQPSRTGESESENRSARAGATAAEKYIGRCAPGEWLKRLRNIFEKYDVDRKHHAIAISVMDCPV